jgi:hypothetical protein
MRNLRASVPWLLIAPWALLLESCTMGTGPRTLQSVTISPTTANAPNSSSGQVQFIATGHYNTEPYIVTPLAATWGVSISPLKAAGITQNGLATCNQDVAGKVAVEAWVQVVPATCNTIDSAGRPGCGNVGGAAQLTCP